MYNVQIFIIQLEFFEKVSNIWFDLIYYGFVLLYDFGSQEDVKSRIWKVKMRMNHLSVDHVLLDSLID